MSKATYTGTRTEKTTIFDDSTRATVIMWDDRSTGDPDHEHVHFRLVTLRDGVEQYLEGGAEHIRELKKILASFGL